MISHCWPRRFMGFVLALMVTTLSGSLIQTQINLAALLALGADIPLATRILVSVQDLVGFAPLYAVIVALTLAGALPLAALAQRGVALPAELVFALAAALGLWVAFLVADLLAPMPTLIAATRGWPGTLAMMAGAGMGGLVYARCRLRWLRRAS